MSSLSSAWPASCVARLSLRFNGVDVQGARALAAAIAAGGVPRLQRLDLRSNPIDGEGAEAAMDALRRVAAGRVAPVCELLV